MQHTLCRPKVQCSEPCYGRHIQWLWRRGYGCSVHRGRRSHRARLCQHLYARPHHTGGKGCISSGPADAVISVAHFKGHELSGFGGTLKNLGMGCASRAGKQVQHSDLKPRTNPGRCVGCGRCVRYCPAGAITIVDKRAKADWAKCIGCGECVVVCRHKAMAVNWMKGRPEACSVGWRNTPQLRSQARRARRVS